MVSHHHQDGHPSSQGQSPTIQKLKSTRMKCTNRHGIWHLDLFHKIKTRLQLPQMVSHHHQDGHPPFKGWLPTIKNLTEGSELQNWNLAHRLNHKIKTRWQLPPMVTHHPTMIQNDSKTALTPIDKYFRIFLKVTFFPFPCLYAHIGRVKKVFFTGGGWLECIFLSFQGGFGYKTKNLLICPHLPTVQLLTSQYL